MDKCKICDYIYEKNKANLSDTALVYMGKKYTYQTLFENIDKVANAFYSMGIREGDRVAVCSVTTPEIIYSIYGLNKLGVTVNLLEPRNNAERIKEYLLMSECEYMIMLDICYPKIQSIVKDTKLKKIIVVSPINAASFVYKAGYKITAKTSKIPFGDMYESWKEFMKKIDISEDIPYVAYDDKRPAVIVYVAHMAFFQDEGTTDNIIKQIRSICREKLPENHYPSLIKLYDEALPVSPSGKLNTEKMRTDISDLI